MTGPADNLILELQREYLAELPVRLEELEADATRFEAGDPDATASLRTHLHRLAGSGGSYGFPDISTAARELERWVAAGPPRDEIGRLREGLVRLAAVVRRARGAAEAEPPTDQPTWRARLIPIIPRSSCASASVRARGIPPRSPPGGPPAAPAVPGPSC